MTTSSAEAVRQIACTVRRTLSSHGRRSRVHRACIPIGCMLALSAGHGAIAADQAGNASAAASNAAPAEIAQLQEVVVTATLRKESAQTVPASLTVLSGAQLGNLGVTNLNGVAALVPGLQLTEIEPGYDIEVLRGISTGIQSVGPTVATYFDDTPTTSTSLSGLGDFLTPDPDLFDVQRIEVLEGPQGTLFGASSEGGLIHYVFNQPNLERFGGEAEVGFEGIPGHGTGNSGHLVLNLPLIKGVLAIRLAGFRIENPGFIDNVYRHESNVNTSVSEGGRAAILWTPFDHFQARLTSYYQKLTVNEPPAEDVQPLTLQPTSGALNTAEKMPEPLYSKWFINNLAVSYDFSWATLLSSTSLERQFTGADFDASNLYAVEFAPDAPLGGVNSTLVNAALLRVYDDLKKTTEEVRLTSPSGETVEWLAGFYYTHEAASVPQLVDLDNAAGATNTLLFPGFFSVTSSSLLRETAGYGDITYHFSPSFDLQGGIRYCSIAQEYSESPELLANTLSLAQPFVANATVDKATYLGVARYHFDQHTMLYARVATGYRPGGANDRIPGSVVPATYQSDSLISYELGLKGDLAAGALAYTADVYRIDWKDMQVQELANGFAFYGNGGKAHSQGLELSFGYRPVANLRMSLNGSFDDAKLDEAIPGIAGTGSGDEVPYAPKIALSGTIDYTHALTATTTGFGGLTVTDVGARRAYFSGQTVGLGAAPFVSSTGTLPSYTTLDLRGGVSFEQVTVTVYLQNVTNALGAVALDGDFAGANLVTGTVGPAQLTVIQPRTIGATVRYDF
jgi:iron complex outermembrane recepter protein